MKYAQGDVLWKGYNSDMKHYVVISIDKGNACRMPAGTKEYFKVIGMRVTPTEVWGYQIDQCTYISYQYPKDLDRFEITPKIKFDNESAVQLLRVV